MSTRLAKQSTVAHDPASFYSSLTSRNHHFVDAELQKKLGTVKVLLAGCGTIGGACATPFARLGVQNFKIAEPDHYEVHNLNRQEATLEETGRNKADVQKKNILAINPHAFVEIDPAGITLKNCAALVEWADFIVDGVDISSKEAITAKIALHENASRFRKPVISGLDLGFSQYGYVWDYRDPTLKAFHGRAARAASHQHPLKACFEMYPFNSIPLHSMKMLADFFKGTPPSQLCLAGNLMSAGGASALVRYLRTGELRAWHTDFSAHAYGRSYLGMVIEGFFLKRKIKKLIQSLT